MQLRPSVLLLALYVGATMPSPADSIWVEGEDATRKEVTAHGWYNTVKKEVLSGGNWLSHYGNAAGSAGFEVQVADSASYLLWARLNPVASKPQWRADGGAWTPVDFKEARGQQNIAADNKPDHRFIAWVKLGQLQLAAGKHLLEFRWEGGASNSGGLDCFVLTSDGFIPQGTMKPGASAAGSNAGPAEWFPLLPDNDTFDPRSVIDMSKLVLAPAGEFGFLRADGKDLRFEKGAGPVKLWGCGANVESGRYSREQLTQRVKYLRKFGVNVIRQHPVFDELSTNGKIDPKKLDEYDWWFAELKKHGIYSDWSVFYHFTIGPEDGYDPALFAELEGRGQRKDTYGIITMSPELWEIRNKTLGALLQHKNPYTGLRYADDPALAIVEMQNEDSIFFWNPLGWLAEGKRMPMHSKLLRERFAAWVKAKYKTDEALKAAWGELRGGDSVGATELRIMSPYDLDGKGPRGTFAGLKQRAGDYIEFLTEMQVSLFKTGEKTIRDAGFKGVTMTTGWQVGGAATEAANTYSDTVGGMIDRHNYAGGGAGGHGITEGAVKNESHLSRPGSGIFSTAMKQVESKPFSMTEWTQSPPNQWKVECAPIFAFYGMGLQGWDASFHFAQSGTRLGDGWPRMSSYVTDTPHYIGQFPALAFAVHRGHIAESAPVAARRLAKADLFAGVDVLKQDATKGGYDVKTLVVDGGTPLESFAIGRVTLDFAGGKTEQVPFDKYWSQTNKVITSATGQLVWDYGRETIQVRSSKTQAVIGKTGANTFELPAVNATFKTPFVSTIFTPLDDLPLSESKHILITALAQDKQAGARYGAEGANLESTGTAPLLLEPVQATIRFAGAKPATITPCDHYGVPMANKQVPVAADGSFVIDGTYRAYYYEVKR